MPSEIEELHRRAPLTDVHCHPSLMSFLYGRQVILEDDASRPVEAKGFSTRVVRTSFPRLLKGGVRVFGAAHFVPERAFFKNPIARAYVRLASIAYRQGFNVPQDVQLSSMIADFEAAAAQAGFQIARSGAHLVRLVEQHSQAVFHTLEGTHVLEDLFIKSGPEACVALLRKHNIAAVVVPHLFPNRFCPHIEALPYAFPKAALCLGTKPNPHGRLTEDGQVLILALDRAGILLDLMHASPPARQDILDLLPPQRPVLSTHTGIRRMFNNDYNLSDSEVRAIVARDGLIGVIFMPHWLIGRSEGDGVNHIVQTILGIRDIVGTTANVCIGSDFDGFTDPPDDLRDPTQLGVLTQRLMDSGITDEAELLGILGGNAIRVLGRGWIP